LPKLIAGFMGQGTRYFPNNNRFVYGACRVSMTYIPRYLLNHHDTKLEQITWNVKRNQGPTVGDISNQPEKSGLYVASPEHHMPPSCLGSQAMTGLPKHERVGFSQLPFSTQVVDAGTFKSLIESGNITIGTTFRYKERGVADIKTVKIRAITQRNTPFIHLFFENHQFGVMLSSFIESVETIWMP
jgi:hypothetical protein